MTRVPKSGDFIKIANDSAKVYLKVKPGIPKVTYSDQQESLLMQPFQYLKAQVNPT